MKHHTTPLVPSTRDGATTIRLLTWNIHKGIGGVDRRYRPERVIEVVEHYSPDVVMLQEVDDGVPRSRKHRQVDHLGEALGYAHRAFAANVSLRHGCYGNATLSRFPMTRDVNVDLTYTIKKARGGLVTDLRVPCGEHRYMLHLVNIHLGLAGVERRWQVRRLLASPPLAHLDLRSRMVVAGDINDWSGGIARWFSKKQDFQSATQHGSRRTATFPAWRPVGALDGVFARGPIQVVHQVSPRLALAREASDHLPVIVDLELLPHD